ncbi:MAG TPA: hypothetical protein VFH54_12710 [Mycobacteriales bacterium]|nr:hypothetical protein [Mycobacteriales bacterium]
MPEHESPAAKMTGSASAVFVADFATGQVRQVWPPPPVGCACRSEDMDPSGCVPEYDMPGVGAVVPLEAYRAVVDGDC